jgi:virulence factor
MERIVEVLKKIRKQQTLKRNFPSKYAFVGIGNHSTNNLYPVLDYLHVTLKYIVTKSRTTADLINRRHSVRGTADWDAVLADREINGVLICAAPDSHYALVKKALLAGKNVFVEKPPCADATQLRDLIQTTAASKKICLAGLQKRYSPCVGILRKELDRKDIISYNYRFVTGSYPEGDAFLELFIHPLDLVSFLFGEAEIASVVKTKASRGQYTVFVHAGHQQIAGSIEISTQYAWHQSEEHLLINTSGGVYEMKNHQSLTFRPKPGHLFSIPKEKIFPSPPEIKYLFGNNSFLPIMENNSVVSQGFYEELKTFFDLCENRKATNLSSPDALMNTFQLIEKIKHA